MISDFLHVKAGDPVTAELWNRMLASARASQLCLGGENVNVHQLPHGSLINSRFVRAWVHPWRVIASTSFARFHPGTINGMTPTISGPLGKDIPMNNNPQPTLPMSTSAWDDQGFAWIVLELTFADNTWRDIKKAEILQRPNVTREDSHHLDSPQLYLGYAGFNDSLTARYPLVRLQRISGTTGTGKLAFNYWQVAMFNLQHQAVPPIEGQTGISRHYFWPA